PARALARRGVDRDRVASNDGGRGTQWRGGGGRPARPRHAGQSVHGGGGDGMSITLPSLHRGRDAVTPALRAALDRLDETSRAQAAYHLCWTDVDGQPVVSGGGKAVRPALALLSAEAAGAPAEIG